MNTNVILYEKYHTTEKVMAVTICTKHATPCTALHVFFQQAALQKDQFL